MASREATLKADLERIENDLDFDPNGGSRRQRQIDRLAEEVAYLLKKAQKRS